MGAPWEKYQKGPWEKYGQAPTEEEQPGLLESTLRGIGSGIGKATSALDSVTGAPVRAAIGSLQDKGGISGAINAYKNQFGGDSHTAPSPEQIAAKAGLPTEPADVGYLADTHPLISDAPRFSPAAVAGVGIGIATDPLTYAPLGAISKGIGSLAEKASPYVAKAAETFSGVPKNEVFNYIKNLPEVNERIAKYGADFSGASDAVRAKFMSDLNQARQARNATISQAIASRSPEALEKNFTGTLHQPQSEFDVQPVLDQLAKKRDSLNPNFKQDSIEEINSLIQRYSDISNNGKMSLRNLFDLKQDLMDVGKGAYRKDGKIFLYGTDTAKAAKGAGSVARKTLNTAAPDIAKANNELSLMHSLEDRVNPNLITPGRPEGALTAAGSSEFNRGRKQLGQLGELTGTDMVQDADILAAQKRFTNPDWLPIDSTGKSFTRLAVGAGVGSLKGGPIGIVLGLGATSPAVIKGGINAAAKVGEIGSAIANNPITKPAYMASEGIQRLDVNDIAKRLSQNPETARFIPLIQNAASRNPDALASTHFILQSAEPAYREAMRKAGEES